MNAILWLVIGAVVGGLARFVVGQRSFGWLSDLMLGLFGSLVGGWTFRMLGMSTPDDMFRSAIVAFFGAIVLLGVARAMKPVSQGVQKLTGSSHAHLDLTAYLRSLGHIERQVIERFARRTPTVRDPNVVFDEQRTFGQRVADRVSAFGGSWPFIGWFALITLLWIVVNTETRARFDPFPFILLNLMLSCLAAIQAPVILMSQNRQAAKDRSDARLDYEVNMRTEMEIQRLHAKLDEHSQSQWSELMALQKRQIELLESIRGGGQGTAS